MNNMKILCISLGCDKNLVDSEHMLGLLVEHGFEITDSEEDAEVIVINTCCFIHDAKEESIQNILEMAKYRTAGSCKVLLVTGCMAERYRDEIIEEIPEVDAVLGTNSYDKILDAIQDVLGGDRFQEYADLKGLPKIDAQRVVTTGGHYEYLKIAEGCDKHCTYCIIPYARGRVRSMPLEAAVAQATGLAAEGYREIVINGIEISSWGWEWKDGSCLRQLLAALCEAVPGVRIRLGSLEPRTIDEAFCKTLSGYANLCPQFHLSLQSGCTATLRRMRRVYTAEQYAQVVDQIRAAYGSRPVSFTTDCICGFPGETPEDFAESCDFLKKIGFLKVHVFPYSRRSGTPAYDFPEQVHEREKQERSRVMNGIAEEVRREVLAAYVGTEDDVLLETPLSGTLFTGYTRLYIPVVVSAPGHESGQIVHVRLGEYDGERVRAALC